MTKTSRQKFKYLKNKKNVIDETKIIFHHSYRAFIKANITIESPTLRPS